MPHVKGPKLRIEWQGTVYALRSRSMEKPDFGAMTTDHISAWLSKYAEPPRRAIQPLTVERARHLLSYHPTSGRLTWNVDNGKAKKGKRAGFINRTTGYRMIGIDGQMYQEHRVIWLIAKGMWPPDQTDHWNLDKTDNRFDNLRDSDNGGNACNRGRMAKNTSGVKGVSWHQRAGKWTAMITSRGVTHYLGLFDDRQAAADAYAAAVRLHHGEFGRTDDGQDDETT